MTELEKIAYAKSFIDKLANGINPLDNSAISEYDIVKNVRISRCLFYVSEILGKVCQNGGFEKQPRPRKIPFSITPEQAQRYECTRYPIPISEISRKFLELTGNENMRTLPTTAFTGWLISAGLLTVQPYGEGRTVKRPTPDGIKFGISTEICHGQYGDYTAVLYDANAQRFIADNIFAIIDSYNTKSNGEPK